ncbi:MAG: hypothetical protein JXA11_09595 [Phycisphaerae bacterium]|nr:hypothetical protein [Phycisphaerae bacterium]
MKSVEIGNRLELFVDRFLVDAMENVSFRLHEPVAQPLPASPLPISYTTVLKEGETYRAYYRDYHPEYDGEYEDGNEGEITCYAQSADGHEWMFPDLGVCDVKSKRGGNVILADVLACAHNFSPIRDHKPGVAPDAQYKALAGLHPSAVKKPECGLYAFQSQDGIHWTKMRDKPVITSERFAFDSQNVSFWSEAEGCYVSYYRTWQTPHGNLRTISRATSDDYLHWSEPTAMNPNLPGEHIYTSQTHPYFRAPHIYIATPTRFMPDRGESTDILFMAARPGATAFERLFTEAFIRPGLDPNRWGNRSNYVNRYVVPTGPAEMSIWHSSGIRYTLRTDGFISVRAGAEQGEFLTKPLTFTGETLVVNYSTSAAGGLRVELQDVGGEAIPGFRLDDCPVIVGDAIEHTVTWKDNPSLAGRAGKPVRLRFVMNECDVYSLQFRHG